MFNRTEQNTLNNQAIEDPQPGDYWNEMLCGTCVILEVEKDQIILCKTKEYPFPDQQQWRFNLTKLHKTTKSQFAKWISYKGCALTWADVRRFGEKSLDVVTYLELRNTLNLENLPSLLSSTAEKSFVGLDNRIKTLCEQLNEAAQVDLDLDPELDSQIKKSLDQLNDLRAVVQRYL